MDMKVASGANASDLDAWLDKVEQMGELKRITAQVDPDLEAATITYLVGSEKSPARLLGTIKGHPGTGRSPPRGGPHPRPGRQPKEPGPAVREHQGPSRPQGALQHGRLQLVA